MDIWMSNLTFFCMEKAIRHIGQIPKVRDIITIVFDKNCTWNILINIVYKKFSTHFKAPFELRSSRQLYFARNTCNNSLFLWIFYRQTLIAAKNKLFLRNIRKIAHCDWIIIKISYASLYLKPEQFFLSHGRPKTCFHVVFFDIGSVMVAAIKT